MGIAKTVTIADDHSNCSSRLPLIQIEDCCSVEDYLNLNPLFRRGEVASSLALSSHFSSILVCCRSQLPLETSSDTLTPLSAALSRFDSLSPFLLQSELKARGGKRGSASERLRTRPRRPLSLSLSLASSEDLGWRRREIKTH